MRSERLEYLDFYRSELGVAKHCTKSFGYAVWQHQQTKVDELTKQRDSFIKAYEIEVDKSVELQKRLDAAIYLLPSIKAENDLWGCDQVEHQIELLEQALKGGSTPNLNTGENGECRHFSTTMFNEGKAECSTVMLL